jgi:acyl CoA:acetate/3-ketoacid CoA transferase alpha subunit
VTPASKFNHLQVTYSGIELDFGMGPCSRPVRLKVIASPGRERGFERVLANELSCETSQEVLAEKFRAGGAGIPGFYAPAPPMAQARRGANIRIFFDGRRNLFLKKLFTPMYRL